MSTSYPSALDAFSNPSGSDLQNSASVPHATQHTNLNDAIEAIEAELGVLPKGSSASVKERLDAIDLALAAIRSGSSMASGSITAAKLASDVFGSGLTPNGGTNAIDVNVDNTTVEISSDALRVKAGGIGSSHITTGAISTASQIVDGTITPPKMAATAFTAYTPSWTNVTIGSGTNSGKYLQLGKLVLFSASFTFGSGSAMGTAPTVSLPVTAVGVMQHSLSVGIFDTSATAPAGNFMGTHTTGTTTIALSYVNAAATAAVGAAITSTTPMTWATGDVLTVKGWYEAA